MPVEAGTSQTTGREWKSREFVAEEIEDVRYPNQVLMRLSGDDVKLIDGVNVGDTVELGFNSRVRSFQTRDGKTMKTQENNCWKIVVLQNWGTEEFFLGTDGDYLARMDTAFKKDTAGLRNE